MPKGIYVRTEEHKQRLRLLHKGKLLSTEQKSALLKAITGRPCSEETRRLIGEANSKSLKGHIPWNKGKLGCYSEGTRGKMSKAHIGKNAGGLNGNWRGGRTSLIKLIRAMPEYREWRLVIFGRDNFTCQGCGERGCYLEAHHRKPFVLILEQNNIKTTTQARKCQELWYLDLGITLCKKCHNLTKHKRGEKINVN